MVPRRPDEREPAALGGLDRRARGEQRRLVARLRPDGVGVEHLDPLERRDPLDVRRVVAALHGLPRRRAGLVPGPDAVEQHLEPALRLRVRARRVQARHRRVRQEVDRRTASARSSTAAPEAAARPARKQSSGAFVRSPLSCAAIRASSRSVRSVAGSSSSVARSSAAAAASASAASESQASTARDATRPASASRSASAFSPHSLASEDASAHVRHLVGEIGERGGGVHRCDSAVERATPPPAREAPGLERGLERAVLR